MKKYVDGVYIDLTSEEEEEIINKEQTSKEEPNNDVDHSEDIQALENRIKDIEDELKFAKILLGVDV